MPHTTSQPLDTQRLPYATCARLGFDLNHHISFRAEKLTPSRPVPHSGDFTFGPNHASHRTIISPYHGRNAVLR